MVLGGDYVERAATRWSAAPNDEVIQIAIMESMEKLGLTIKADS
jgi:hypothetical protein